MINEFIRRSDRVRIACIAQLVNVIAPIRAEKDGPAWRQTIYYPYQLASLYGRGDALHVAVDAPTYDCRVADDVSYLDVTAVHDTDRGMVTLFIVNRHLTETADLNVSLTGFATPELAEHVVMEGHGLNDTNGPEHQDAIAPKPGQGAGVEGGHLRGRLAPLWARVVAMDEPRLFSFV